MATVETRPAIIRSEKAAWPTFSSNAYLEELVWDSVLLGLVLVAWVITWFVKGQKKLGRQQAAKVLSPETTDIPERVVLGTPKEVACVLLDAKRSNVLDIYRQYRQRMDWSVIPAEDTERIFFNLCLTASRLGKTKAVEGILADMERHRIPRSPELYACVVKMATSKRLFKETLSLWQWIHADRVVITDRAIWSCLLFAATEEKALAPSKFFFSKLCANGGASPKDYGNMIRLLAAQGEGLESFTLLEEMRAQGLEPDVYVYNSVFAACAKGGKHLDLSAKLMPLMSKIDDCVDTITYNTLIKGLVQAGRIDDAFVQLNEMEASGLAPTQVTFGTLIDACVNEGCLDRAHQVLMMMRDAGCEMNTVLYTTMIKGFAKMGKVQQALQVYDSMCKEGVKPDHVTFSLIIKALCDAGQMERALVLFEKICEDGHQPDEILFNNLLSGCVVRKNPALGEKLLDDMLRLGISPSIATFSTFMKLYAECDMLPQAYELLDSMEDRFGIVPETRLYLQMIHTSLRMRQRQLCLDFFRELLKRHGSLEDVEVSKMLRSSINFNLPEVAVQLATMVLQSGGRVGSKDLQAIADRAAQKRKLAVVDEVVELAQKNDIYVKHPLRE